MSHPPSSLPPPPIARGARATGIRPGAGRTPPLDRHAGPGAAAWQDPEGVTPAEMARHEREVAGYPAWLALRILRDSAWQRTRRKAWHEVLWIRARRVALGRRVSS